MRLSLRPQTIPAGFDGFSFRGFRKPVINPFAPQHKPKLDGPVFENESVLRQYCRQDFIGNTGPYFSNGSEMVLVRRIKDSRNGNKMPSVLLSRHD
ncbi:MAG TPA: hypothetical protein VN843_30475 [Anaerolineales bacterium]|nr:hypothetical protein [Anaerolineales bacterium]